MLPLGAVAHTSSQVLPSSRASVASGSQSWSWVGSPDGSVVVDPVAGVQDGSVDGVDEPPVEVDGDVPSVEVDGDVPSVEVEGDGLPEVASGVDVSEPEGVCDDGDEVPVPAVPPDELGEPLPEGSVDPEEPAAADPEPLCDGVPEDDPAAVAVLEPVLPLAVVAAAAVMVTRSWPGSSGNCSIAELATPWVS